MTIQTAVLYEEEFLSLLAEELVVALGCTEPVAIAYAAALARQEVAGQDITAIEIAASGNVIKNAMSVKIPGTALCGIDAAAALGAVAGDSSRQLEVLDGITAAQIEEAVELIKDGRVKMAVADTDKKLYIDVTVVTAGQRAQVVIADQHTNVVRVAVDETIRWQKGADETVSADRSRDVSWFSLESIWDFVKQVEPEKLTLVAQSIALNKEVARDGLESTYGLQVGRTIRRSVTRGLLADDISTAAMSLAAAASDARMAGSVLPVMSNSGSGNQGLCATLPVVAAGEKLAADAQQLLRAVALSNLVTIYIKSKFGRLSALCGATVAASGASCGIVYLLGGSLTACKHAVQNMLGNVTGMLCDGAKAGCAMKVATCVSGAVQSAILAIDDLAIQATDGIIEADADSSIDNMCRLGNLGTAEADRIILDIMLNKRIG